MRASGGFDGVAAAPFSDRTYRHKAGLVVVATKQT
jgi:hypothetical protein